MQDENLLQNPRFWVAVAFVVFVVVFGRKLWSALAAMLDKRTDAIRAELSAAQLLRQEAEALLRDARQRRETALEDAKTLLEHAKTEAERLAREAAADAEAAAARRERMAVDRIAAAEKAAVDDVRKAAADIAATAAERVIRDTLTQDSGAALVDKAITDLPGALRAA